MKKYTRKNLNVKRLLELGDLNIRGIAEQNEDIAADEYFSKVEQFIENVPGLRSELSSISKLEENIKTLRELETKLGVSERSVDISADTKILCTLGEIKTRLTEIGYDKLNFDIDSVSKAIESGDLILAEKLSDEVLQKFDELFERIRHTYSIKKFAKTKDEESNVQANAVSLKDALNYFDHEEATRKLRILAVDDIAVVLNTITSVLNPYYEVFALKNSSQVEDFLAYTTPELFLLDIEMNEINGFDLVPLIRKFEKHKDTPIIFLTGNASLDNLKDAITLGACDFITKPVDRDILLEKIKKNIVRKKAY